jgi:hypothetical protein
VVADSAWLAGLAGSVAPDLGVCSSYLVDLCWYISCIEDLGLLSDCGSSIAYSVYIISV